MPRPTKGPKVFGGIGYFHTSPQRNLELDVIPDLLLALLPHKYNDGFGHIEMKTRHAGEVSEESLKITKTTVVMWEDRPEPSRPPMPW